MRSSGEWHGLTIAANGMDSLWEFANSKLGNLEDWESYACCDPVAHPTIQMAVSLRLSIMGSQILAICMELIEGGQILKFSFPKTGFCMELIERGENRGGNRVPTSGEKYILAICMELIEGAQILAICMELIEGAQILDFHFRKLGFVRSMYGERR